jgi:hypothetical protein
MAGSASDYLAAERTVLAWIRTGIALMGLRYLLAQFGPFLQEFNHLQPEFQGQTVRYFPLDRDSPDDRSIPAPALSSEASATAETIGSWLVPLPP